jgi:Ice-binding-like
MKTALMFRTMTLHGLTAGLVAVALLAACGGSVSSSGSSSAALAAAPSLGTASNFAVLSATVPSGGAVTCTDSTITGNVGSSGVPASITNTRCTITGATSAPVSPQVLTDFNSAYAELASAPCDVTIEDAAFTNNVPALGPLAPGVYCFPAAVTFTDTTLTLDGSTNPNGIWIFKVGAALTGSGFQVVMANGGNPCNVFWSVGAAATLSTSTLPPKFLGNILAGAAITITGGTFDGDALAKAAVTMTGTTATGCGAAAVTPLKHCNQGVGNGPEFCDPGNSNQGDPSRSNDELGGTPGNPGRKGGNGK